MAAPMTRQKCHALALERADDESVGRLAKWSLNFNLIDLLQLRHLIEAAAADDSDFRRGHLISFVGACPCPVFPKNPRGPGQARPYIRFQSPAAFRLQRRYGRKAYPDRDKTNTSSPHAPPGVTISSSLPGFLPDKDRIP